MGGLERARKGYAVLNLRHGGWCGPFRDDGPALLFPIENRTQIESSVAQSELAAPRQGVERLRCHACRCRRRKRAEKRDSQHKGWAEHGGMSQVVGDPPGRAACSSNSSTASTAADSTVERRSRTSLALGWLALSAAGRRGCPYYMPCTLLALSGCPALQPTRPLCASGVVKSRIEGGRGAGGGNPPQDAAAVTRSLDRISATPLAVSSCSPPR